MKIKKIYLKIILLVVIVIPLEYVLDYTDKKIFKSYNQFNQTNIDGEIESVGEMFHGASFKTKNNAQEFQFYPYGDKNGVNFTSIASEGVRVIKPAYSDTLILNKNKMEWKFTFRHVEPDQ